MTGILDVYLVVDCSDSLIGKRAKRVRHYQGCTNLSWYNIYIYIYIYTVGVKINFPFAFPTMVVAQSDYKTELLLNAR